MRRLFILRGLQPEHKNFNPHTREGCDDYTVLCLVVYCISIHTPAKGATSTLYESGARIGISIHTPAKGATPSYFRGNDTERISIHTPAKGATKSFSMRQTVIYISIHTPAKGATHHLHHYIYAYRISIHTPAKGATDFSLFAMGNIDFNPHTREGCDDIIADDFAGLADISIHTPAKGATLL